jgi:hypothetical protein
MTDRDQFAAAALTGLLAGSEHTCDVDGADHAETAYHIADAMLRERGKEVRDNCVAGNNPKMECPVSDPNHDAVPDARASDDRPRTDKADLPELTGTGNTQRPVAWVRFYPNGGPQSVYLDRPPPDAEPLYRSPTLTDEERAAIEWSLEAADIYARVGHRQAQEAAVTFRKLLERTK